MLVIYGSSRENGNTEALANILLNGIEVEEIYLRKKVIKPITDKRHDQEGFTYLADDYYDIVSQLLNHDHVVFVTPLYWYGMSGVMKLFIDRWSESLRDEKLDFREKMKHKKMYVMVVGGDNPKQKALPLIMQFKHIFDFFDAQFEGYLIGEASLPGDILADTHAIDQAKQLNKTIKKMAGI